MILKLDKIKKVGTNELAIDIDDDSRFLDDAGPETLEKVDDLVSTLVGALDENYVIAAHMFIDGLTHICHEVRFKIKYDADALEKADKENGVVSGTSPNKHNIMRKRIIEKELEDFGEQCLVCYSLLVAWMYRNAPSYSYDPLWDESGIPESIDLDELRDCIEERERRELPDDDSDITEGN